MFRCIRLPLENRLAALATFRPSSWAHHLLSEAWPRPEEFPVDGIPTCNLTGAFGVGRGPRKKCLILRGGRCRDRTCDPLHVKEVLFR
jgi:hypothetical protein